MLKTLPKRKHRGERFLILYVSLQIFEFLYIAFIYVTFSATLSTTENFQTLNIHGSYQKCSRPCSMGWLVGWLVGCGLTSHSAIFQLYSDGTAVQFQNFDLLSGTQHHGQLGVFSVPSLPRHGHRDVRRRLLPPCHQRAHTQ